MSDEQAERLMYCLNDTLTLIVDRLKGIEQTLESIDRSLKD